ncbi:MAG TPA: aminotransferase class V-fold PLP-dependent enzyme [Bryobacteraceae bacterium]|nr:aminotransferase class V-fold PLP-dependent enzyme [Bryobacteraceae bacterium]
MNWESIRAEFPALANWTWLNTATFGQVPTRARAAVDRHFAHRDETASADFLNWFDDVDAIRALVGRLINCEADDIAFAANAASALSLFLGGMEWNEGDRIVTLRDEFPNQYYFAASLASRGVELVELNEINQLPDRTRAVILSTVNYSNGYRPDVELVSQLTHRAGALLYLDGTQSVGALRFDIARVKPDMLAVDGYKWLLTPNGATFFYISPDLRRTLHPSVMGWRSDKGWRSVDELQHGIPVLPDSAEKYEGGMLNFGAIYGAAESIRMMLEIGPERIEQRVLELAGLTAQILRQAGASIVNDNTNVVAAHWHGRDVSALAKQLQQQRIIVAARHGNLRVSPHFYNTEADLERLRAALAA